jgi:Protein of unknown function (DUF3383)
MAQPALPLSLVEPISIQISPQFPTVPTFNQGLIIGSSPVIPYTTRIEEFGGLSSVLAAGFSTTSPEYIAADLYFSQSPTPQVLWIGLQNSTGINTIAVGTGGTGYLVGDIVGIVQTSASGGQATVAAISTGGVVTSLVLLNAGNGYTPATGLATSGGSGTGLTVNLTGTGETALQAIIACQAASSKWYGVFCCSTSDSDILAIAPYVQGTVGSDPTLFVYNTSDAACASNAPNNLFAELSALSYNRVIGIYSTTQASAYPNNAYAGAAVLGMLMGLNTGLANSQFTAMFKDLVGVAPEPLSLTQVQNIENNFGNVFVGYQYSYTWFEKGTVPDGQYIDEIMGIDYLIADLQISVADVLISIPSVPQTNAGQQYLINACTGACQRSVTRGFIAPGVWQGQQVLNLTMGDQVPLGFLIQSQSYAVQSASARAARQAMPIYIALIEAGAVQFVAINVYIQR